MRMLKQNPYFRFPFKQSTFGTGCKVAPRIISGLCIMQLEVTGLLYVESTAASLTCRQTNLNGFSLLMRTSHRYRGNRARPEVRAFIRTLRKLSVAQLTGWPVKWLTVEIHQPYFPWKGCDTKTCSVDTQTDRSRYTDWSVNSPINYLLHTCGQIKICLNIPSRLQLRKKIKKLEKFLNSKNKK